MNVDRRWRVVAVVAAAFGVMLVAGLVAQRQDLRARGIGVAHASVSDEALLSQVGMVAAPRSVAVAAPGDPPITILAAGDIAGCDGTGDEQTAAMLAENPDVTVLTLGDHAYVDGTAAEFRNCFDPSWGLYKNRLRPVPGNHEYHTSNADPYFEYFGARAGPSENAASRGYYSFDLGAWHVVALNSEQDIAADGAQLAWLRADLAATSRQCILAYWHQPQFTADEEHADFADVRPFWEALYAAGADVILNGHSHSYQRYRRMDPAGETDSEKGIREFVVGTGGRNAHPLRPDQRRDAGHSAPGFVGLLELRLGDSSYEWTFLPGPGQAYSDSGTERCR